MFRYPQLAWTPADKPRDDREPLTTKSGLAFRSGLDENSYRAAGDGPADGQPVSQTRQLPWEMQSLAKINKLF